MMYSVRKRVSGKVEHSGNNLLSLRVLMTKGTVYALIRSLCLVTVKLMVNICKRPVKLCLARPTLSLNQTAALLNASIMDFALSEGGKYFFSIEGTIATCLFVFLREWGRSSVKTVHGPTAPVF